MKTRHIGTIEVACGKAIACDFGRKGAGEKFSNVVIRNMLPGIYNADIVIFDNEDARDWGDKIAEWFICHQDYNSYEAVEKVVHDVTCIGIDANEILFSNGTNFCWEACEAANGKNVMNITDDNIECNVYVTRNYEGKVVAAIIEFIQGKIQIH